MLLTFGASETFANYPVGLHVTLSTPSTAQANGSPEVNLTKTINGPDSLTGSLDGHWVRSSVTSTGHVLWEASDGTTIGPFNFGGRGHWQYHYFADGYKGYFAASPTLTPTPTPTPAYSGPLWYVRTSGNDSNDGSSPSKAFRTISKAASKAVAGHTVIIGGGTYAEDVTVSRSGTSSQNILFRNDDGNQTGDGGNVLIRSMKLTSADYILLSGLKFAPGNGGTGVALSYAKNSLLENCESSGGKYGMTMVQSSATLTSCKIHDATHEGIELDGSKTVTLSAGCEIYDCGKNGISLKGGQSALAINDSTLRNNGDSGLKADDNTDTSVVIVERSKFLNNGDCGAQVKGCYLYLTNCLVAFNADEGVEAKEKGSLAVRHCTVVYNGDDGVDRDSSEATCNISSSILAFNGDNGLDFSDTRLVSHGDNLLFGNRRGNFSGSSAGSNEIQADPKFISSTDFRLRSGSPAIDAVNVAQRDDLTGGSRPLGARSDMGCYEGFIDTTRTFYVRTDGDDSRDGLSRNQAFRTIGKAASVVEPGDKVYVGGGTYRDTAVCSKAGSEEDPIRFIADTNGSKTGKSGAVVLASQEHGKWSLQVQANYLKFEGFSFTGEEMTYVSDGTNQVYNYPYGVYVHVPGGEVTFENCDFTKMVHPLYSVYSGLRVVGCKFHDNISYSFIGYYGGVIVENCDFTGTGHGPYSYRNHFTHIKNSRIKDMSGWSVLIHMEPYSNYQPFGTNTPTIENCQIDGNQQGLYLVGAKSDDDIKFINSPIKSTKSWEMYLVQCDLKLTPAWRAKWPIEKSGTYGILTWYSKLDVQNMTFEGYTGQAFYSRYDELTMRNCVSRNNGRGLDIYYPKDGKLNDIDVINNTSWGLHVWTNDEYQATLTNCKIESNANGAYFNGATKDNLRINNTTIANNPGQGVQFYQCEAEMSPRTMGSRWRMWNNGYGVVSYYSKMLLEDITIRDCSVWGAVLHYGEATVRNCNFTNNANGLYVYHNQKAEVTNCHMDDNTTHGLAVAANGQYHDYDATGDAPGWKWMNTPNAAQIRNCTMDRNAYGLYVNRSTEDKLRIDNSPIRDNRSAGLYFSQSVFALNPTTINRLFDMSGNQNFIYASYGRYTFEDLEVADVSGYGIHTWYSDVRLKNCNFYRNPHIAFYSYFDKSLEAQNCKFQENGWGFYAYNNRTYYNNGYVHGGETGWQPNDGPLRLVNCDISKNTHGVGLIYGVDDSIEFIDTPIHDNTSYGLYTVHGEMNFNPTTMAKNWDLYNNGYHVVAGYGKYTFRDLTFADAKAGGVSTHYGDVVVKNCKFTGNRSYGFQSYYNKSFMIEDSQIVDNGYVDDNGNRQGTGMHVAHGKSYTNVDGTWDWREVDTVAVIKNTPITNNGTYGLQLGWGRDDNIRVANSPISGHRGPGLYASNCQFNFTPATMGSKWQMFDNGSHIYACWGKYLFEDLELKGAPSYGAATWGSDVTVRNCKFNENGSYGFHSHYDTLLVENSEFNNNAWAGITLRNTHPDPAIGGSMTIRNSKIDGNGGYGIYAPNCSTKVNPITFVNTPISNNVNGVYFNQCDIEFKPGSFVMDWKLENNTNNNFVIRSGTTLIENVTMSGAPGWMFNTAYGEVVAKNSNFTDNGSGLYLHANFKSIVENCKFTDNTSWGVWTRPYYGYDTTDADGNPKRVEYQGPVKLTNVESLRNGNGLGVYDYTVSRDNIALDNVTIADNTSWGIQFNYLNGELNPKTFGQFDRALKGNTNGVYFSYGNFDLVGLSIGGNQGWGGHAVYSKLRLKDCSFSGNGSGFYWYAGWDQPFMKELTFDVDNCHFDSNSSGQGLLTYWGKTTVRNSTFNNNNDGYYTAYNTLSNVENCEMKGNRRWGVVLHVNYAMWNDTWLDDRKSWYQDNFQTLTNCVIDGNANGLHVYNAKNEHFKMNNVQITNNHSPDSNGSPVGQGLYLTECRYVWDSQQADNVVIRGNGYGIGLYGSVQGEYTIKNANAEDCKRHGLIVANCKARAENCQFTGPIYGLYWSRPKLVDVVNCRFEAGPQNTGWAAHGYGGPVENDPSVVKITNSIFNNYSNGLYTYVYGDEAYTPEITAYNNTFANLSNAGVYANNNSSPVVRNNIFAHKPGSTSGYGLGRNTGANANVVHSHNLLSGFSTPLASGLTDPNETTLVKAPHFADEANGNFRLGKGSPAINAGTDLGIHVPYDMEGNSRPSYKVFEIGAYEYTSSSGAFRVVDWAEKK
ncbi:MAG: right-handed parallel beta-helix repeat-containing protein [Planctomycetales bacterium]|nr:right-handed parallel beta-helix repeat-containing protein [Planctomycetales bacterium]